MCRSLLLKLPGENSFALQIPIKILSSLRGDADMLARMKAVLSHT